MRKSKVNKKLEELKHFKEENLKLHKENKKLIEQLDDATKENLILKIQLDEVVTKTEILDLLDNRITWYEGRIKECRGLYTDVYVENLLIGKYETEQIMEFILEHTFDKKE